MAVWNILLSDKKVIVIIPKQALLTVKNSIYHIYSISIPLLLYNTFTIIYFSLQNISEKKKTFERSNSNSAQITVGNQQLTKYIYLTVSFPYCEQNLIPRQLTLGAHRKLAVIYLTFSVQFDNLSQQTPRFHPSRCCIYKWVAKTKTKPLQLRHYHNTKNNCSNYNNASKSWASSIYVVQSSPSNASITTQTATAAVALQ